jgi:hypothetical protein
MDLFYKRSRFIYKIRSKSVVTPVGELDAILLKIFASNDHQNYSTQDQSRVREVSDYVITDLNHEQEISSAAITSHQPIILRNLVSPLFSASASFLAQISTQPSGGASAS